ncbi:MAG: YeeE/YedE family protein [Pseudomonadota bacterium]
MMMPKVIAAAGAVLVLLALAAYGEGGATRAWALAIGAFAGIALYHASFGFTGGWRRLIRERRGRGVRAQLLLIGLVVLVSYPLIGGWGEPLGVEARGVILPMGIASAFGAFIFGFGMQLGSGCASGTLFTAGGGSTRMILVLAFFITGSVWATYDWDFWASLPRTRAGVSLIRDYGVVGAWIAMAALLGALWFASVLVERRAHGTLEHAAPVTGSWFAGPWSIWTGAAGLALVALLCFIVLGRPWGVTYGFAVWGAQAVELFGATPTEWTYWSGWRRGHVENGPLSNGTTVMNLGILLGAMIAAGLAGRYAPVWRLSARDVATAVVGGLLMGYGARLAYGCNIGAFLGGMTSGSLHGVWWLIWGFAGSWIGVIARGRIGMDPRPAPAAA